MGLISGSLCEKFVCFLFVWLGSLCVLWLPPTVQKTRTSGWLANSKSSAGSSADNSLSLHKPSDDQLATYPGCNPPLPQDGWDWLQHPK